MIAIKKDAVKEWFLKILPPKCAELKPLPTLISLTDK